MDRMTVDDILREDEAASANASAQTPQQAHQFSICKHNEVEEDGYCGKCDAIESYDHDDYLINQWLMDPDAFEEERRNVTHICDWCGWDGCGALCPICGGDTRPLKKS